MYASSSYVREDLLVCQSQVKCTLDCCSSIKRRAIKLQEWASRQIPSICLCRGFQLQTGSKKVVPTIQGVLEQVLCQIRQESRETLRMQCSGRTDAGVHAKGQVMLWQSDKKCPMHFKAMLPDNLSQVIVSCEASAVATECVNLLEHAGEIF